MIFLFVVDALFSGKALVLLLELIASSPPKCNPEPVLILTMYCPIHHVISYNMLIGGMGVMDSNFWV